MSKSNLVPILSLHHSATFRVVGRLHANWRRTALVKTSKGTLLRFWIGVRSSWRDSEGKHFIWDNLPVRVLNPSLQKFLLAQLFDGAILEIEGNLNSWKPKGRNYDTTVLHALSVKILNTPDNYNPLLEEAARLCSEETRPLELLEDHQEEWEEELAEDFLLSHERGD